LEIHFYNVTTVYPILFEMKITQTLNSMHNWTGKPAQHPMKVLQSGMRKNKYLGFPD